MAVVTADINHAQIHRAVQEVLQLMREHLAMDVAFVSKLEHGRRIIKHVDSSEEDGIVEGQHADEIERSFCERVLDARSLHPVHHVHKLLNLSDLLSTAFPKGAHMSVPIVLPDDTIYGTLCCFSFAENHALAERDQKRLKMAADMTARLIAKSIRDENDPASALA